ncbi:hypothetical protein LTR67_007907 [Exophiala xenobiotica]
MVYPGETSSGAGTRILFVPYRPPRSSKQAPDDSEISLQKHAAREYHRKAKLERLAKAYASSRPPPGQRQQEASPRKSGGQGSRRQAHQKLPGMNAFRIRAEASSDCPSPLDVGVGQMDPFNVLMRRDVPPYVQEMLAHALSYQWPVFSCSIAATAISDIKHTILESAMRSPAAFYTIVYAGATHSAFAHTGMQVTRENQILRLTYKMHAIKALSQEISRLQSEDVPDELLLCMVTLGAHGSGDTLLPRPHRTADSSLLTAQNFHYYGHMDWETAHLSAVRVLVDQRGGFHTIKQEFLSNVIAVADVIDAFKTLRPPAYPLRISTARMMAIWPYPDRKALRPFLQNLATGFGSLPESIQLDPLMQKIDAIRDVSIGYDLYLVQSPSAPRHIHIVWGRNTLLHDLLRLPDKSFDNPLAADACLYDMCRLSTLSYMLLVLFPLPRVSGLHYTLAQRIKTALDSCFVFRLWQRYPELSLWATVLGGILAEETALRPWFVQVSASICRERTWQSWDTVKNVCSRFLWFEQDCDQVGEAFWEEVLEHVQPIAPTPNDNADADWRRSDTTPSRNG